MSCLNAAIGNALDDYTLGIRDNGTAVLFNKGHGLVAWSPVWTLRVIAQLFGEGWNFFDLCELLMPDKDPFSPGHCYDVAGVIYDLKLSDMVKYLNEKLNNSTTRGELFEMDPYLCALKGKHFYRFYIRKNPGNRIKLIELMYGHDIKYITEELRKAMSVVIDWIYTNNKDFRAVIDSA